MYKISEVLKIIRNIFMITLILGVILLNGCTYSPEAQTFTQNLDEECKKIAAGAEFAEAKACKFSNDCEQYCITRCDMLGELEMLDFKPYKNKEGQLYCKCTCQGEV